MNVKPREFNLNKIASCENTGKITTKDEGLLKREYSARLGTKERVVLILSKIPVIGNIRPVKSGAKKVNDSLNEKISRFIMVLSESVTEVDESTETGSERKTVTNTQIQDVTPTPEKITGIGMAKNMTRHAVIRIWDFKGAHHPGHASISIKNISRKNSIADIKSYASWWPKNDTRDEKRAEDLKLMHVNLPAAMHESYKVDKVAGLSLRTEKKLNEGVKARTKINKKGIHNVDRKTLNSALYIPRFGQKRMASSDKWGVSAKKIYIPLYGINQSNVEEKNIEKFMFFGLDEAKMHFEAKKLGVESKSKTMKFRLISKEKNCASITARILKAGGSENYKPLPKALLYYQPNNIYDYAKGLQEEVEKLNQSWDNFYAHCEKIEKNNQAKASQAPVNTINKTETDVSEESGQKIQNESTEGHEAKIKSILSQIDQCHQSMGKLNKKEITQLIETLKKHSPTYQDDEKSITIKAKEILKSATSIPTASQGSEAEKIDAVLLMTRDILQECKFVLMQRISEQK